MSETLMPIHRAIKEGNLAEMARLIGDDNHLPCLWTPFGAWRQDAASCGQLETVRWLVARGLDVNACNESNESPPLCKAAARGQRMNKLRPCNDFGQEVGIHHAADHLAALTVFYRLPFESSDCEAAEPAEIVTERPFAGASVVLPKVDILNPMHGFDPPVATGRLH